MHKTIALVSNTSWSFVKFRLKLLTSLKSAGYRVVVIAPPDEESPVFEANGLEYVPISKLKQKGKNPWHDWQFYREIRQVYKKVQPDFAVHYTIKPNIYATKAADSLGVPCMAVITGLGYTFINGGLLSRITDVLYRNALRGAKQVWFLNADDQKVFAEQRQIVPASKTVLIHGEGIDAKEQFNPGRALLHAQAGRSPKFIFVGRLLHDKGIREYVAAAQQLKEQYPDVEFNILGYLNTGNPSAVDTATMEEWGRSGAVRYLGSAADVRPVLLVHDCVVLPSYREGMSTTLMEAASMALPLIASNIPGCRELVDNGVTGYLCEARNAQSLAAQMETFIRLDSASRLAMGQRGREKMLREFDMEATIRQYLDNIPQLMDITPK